MLLTVRFNFDAKPAFKVNGNELRARKSLSSSGRRFTSLSVTLPIVATGVSVRVALSTYLIGCSSRADSCQSQREICRGTLCRCRTHSLKP